MSEALVSKLATSATSVAYLGTLVNCLVKTESTNWGRLVYRENVSTGERLRQRRELANLSLGQVGKYEGVGKQYLSKLELETNKPPVWELLARLARRYRTTTDYLLGLTDDPAPRNGDDAGAAAPVTPVPFRGPVADLVELAQQLSAEQQKVLVALARTLAGAEEAARRRVLADLFQRMMDDIEARLGAAAADELDLLIQQADSSGDPTPLAAWLAERLGIAPGAPPPHDQ